MKRDFSKFEMALICTLSITITATCIVLEILKSVGLAVLAILLCSLWTFWLEYFVRNRSTRVLVDRLRYEYNYSKLPPHSSLSEKDYNRFYEVIWLSPFIWLFLSLMVAERGVLAFFSLLGAFIGTALAFHFTEKDQEKRLKNLHNALRELEYYSEYRGAI